MEATVNQQLTITKTLPDRQSLWTFLIATSHSKPMTWIEEHFAKEYPEIKSIQDVWDKDDLGGYQTQRYSRELNKVIITNDLTAITNDLKSIGLTLSDFNQQLTLF